MPTTPIADLRIGLVLSGGGGKGAYQIGCLKALRCAGVERYAALSGTSVGALNAALVAIGKLDAAERLWREITPAKVIRIDWRKAWLAPLWLVCAYYCWRFGSPATRHHDRIVRWSSAALPFLFLGLLLAIALDLLPHGAFVDPLRRQWQADPSVFIWLLVLGVLTTFAEPVAQVTLRWMMTTNDPLSAYLRAEVRPEDLARADVPFYACVSRLRPFTILSGAWGGWVPDYLRVDRLEHPVALEALLRSAGLPGVFVIKEVLGEEAIDGGMCDNTPVAPLLFDGSAPLDLLIVIYLEAKDGDWTVSDWAVPRWNACQQALLGEARARAIDEDFLDAKRGPFDAIPAGLRLPEIIEVLPSADLGGFFAGTLDFTSPKAIALIELGERDMSALLRARGWLEVDATAAGDHVPHA